MHIPDGFITPKVYLPAWGIAVLAWWICLRRTGSLLDPLVIPRLAVTTSAAFVLSLVTIPLPGGSSVHLTFVGLLTVLFGWRLAFMALSLVFVLQAFLLGDGGITTLPVNILAIAGSGVIVATLVFHLLRRLHLNLALFLAGWTAVVIPSFLIALILGLQPTLAHDASGTPLFFPFGLRVTLPALILPHMILGIGEGMLAVMGWRFFQAGSRRSIKGAIDA
ncbi:MAG: energy-coupling factor ABC transporter permease [Gemmatimonadales bacterium]|nr:energy-coupling factor ABC transporter permease [Gemmatimonadales bacterium]